MSAEWRQVSLKEITSVLGDGLHGTPEYDPNGDHFFINGNNLSNGKIVFNDTTKRVSASESSKHKKNLTDRTILVSINGTLGNVAFYAGEKVVLGKSACYFNVMAGVDKHFIRYVLDSEIFQGYIQESCHRLNDQERVSQVDARLSVQPASRRSTTTNFGDSGVPRRPSHPPARNQCHARSHRPGAVQIVVCRFRPRTRQAGRPRPRRHGRGHRPAVSRQLRGVGAGLGAEGVASTADWRCG